MKKVRFNLLIVLMIALFSTIAAVSTAAEESDEGAAVIVEGAADNDAMLAFDMDPAPVDGGVIETISPSGKFLEGATPVQIAETIAKMSYVPGMEYAQRHGITTIHGKDLSMPARAGKPMPLRTIADRPVGTDNNVAENEPSMSVKPNNSNIIVAASHSIPGTNCVAYYSTDQGETWSYKVRLPLAVNSSCSDPVIRWAPNGARVYAAYMSMNSTTYNIVVSTSIDDGKTWSGPVIALEGTANYTYDKPWLDVHTFQTNVPDRVYVTATKFYSIGGMDIVFRRSTTGGATWTAPIQTLASSPTGNPVIQGSRPIGGKATAAAGNVTVCWYNSETDGFTVGNFSIRCKNSENFGSSFATEVRAFNASLYMTPYGGTYFEVPYWLGPGSWLHRAWGSMFPSMITTPDGVLHIVFAAAPENNYLYPSTAENGDIYYIKSPYPYIRWTRPTRLNDDYSGKAQLYPTITAKRINGGSVLTAFWEDHRNSPYYYYGTGVPGVDCGNGTGMPGAGLENCLYDIYSVSTDPGWGEYYYNANPNKKVTDASSVSQYIFIGDYIDSSTSKTKSDRWSHVIWTDRSTAMSIFDYYASDVYSDQVVS